MLEETILKRCRLLTQLEDRKDRISQRKEKLTIVNKFIDVNAPKYKEEYGKKY